jgi:hypothetical protein
VNAAEPAANMAQNVKLTSENVKTAGSECPSGRPLGAGRDGSYLEALAEHAREVGV